MQARGEEGKHMAVITWEYSGLHTVSRSLIKLLTCLYIALCIPKIVKVFCIVYTNKTPTLSLPALSLL